MSDFPIAINPGDLGHIGHHELLASLFRDQFVQDVLANRPAAGVERRLFFATDTKQWFRDDGAAWHEVVMAEHAAFNDAAIWVDIRSRGAIVDGDSAHDCYPAALSAYNTVKTQTMANAEVVGGVIFIPAGDAHFLQGLTITVPGVWVKGPKLVTSRITASHTIATAAIIFSGTVGVPSGIENVEVRFEAGFGPPSAAQIAVSVVNGNGVRIKELWVNGFYRGVQFSGCGDCGVESSYVELCTHEGYYTTDSEAITYSSCKGYQNDTAWSWVTKRAYNGTTVQQAESTMSNCSDIESVTQSLLIDNYVNINVTGFTCSAGSTQQPTAGIWIKGASAGIGLTGVKITHPNIYGLRVSGACDNVTVSNLQVKGVGYFTAVPATLLYGVYVSNDCTNFTWSTGTVTSCQGNGVYWGASGIVTGVIVHEAGLKLSNTQGQTFFELDLGIADVTKRFTGQGISLRAEGGAHGTGFLMTTAGSGLARLMAGSTYNLSTAYTNSTGGVIVLRGCDFAADVG